MSNYFNLVPDFEYVSRLPDAKISDYITVKNLFKRVFLREDIYQNLTFFKKYSVVGDDRPDNVAAEVYEDSTLDWLVLLANNIINVQDEWPLPQSDFDRHLLDKYDDDYNKIYNGIHHYETVEVKDSNGVIIVPEGLEVSEDFSTTYYDFFISGLTTANNITRPVTNYQYEEKLENKKRDIFILKPEYISVVLDDIDDISSYKKGSTEFIDETLKRAENIRLFQ
tara:strand:+ start:12161 stop:12832 length:672 start_codon:yes stop_codon:yes gene_type:complete